MTLTMLPGLLVIYSGLGCKLSWKTFQLLDTVLYSQKILAQKACITKSTSAVVLLSTLTMHRYHSLQGWLTDLLGSLVFLFFFHFIAAVQQHEQRLHE